MKSRPRSPLSPTLLIGILGVAAVVGAYLWFGMHRAPSANNNGNESPGMDQASVVGPTGAAEPDGTTLAVNATVDGSTVQFIKAYRATDFALLHASEGKEFIVVLFRPLSGDATVLVGSASAATLRAGTATFQPRSVNLTSANDTQANSSLVFEIPKGLTPLLLNFGSKSGIKLDLKAP